MNRINAPLRERAVKVAIIGAACRFPGGSNTPEKYFENLLTGQNYVSDVPLNRWSIDKFFNEKDVSGKAYVNSGHFLQDYDYRNFDAEFFNFSPREVEFLDPQQRLLLELSWEAMEAAGLDVEAMTGSNTGVFVGGFTVDHLLNQFGASARESIGSHSAAGATLTMLSNRISYAFDFHGPSVSLDTACSSSLVAFSQAVTAIVTHQCEAALVGGANFILRPEYTIAMSKGRFLAKDGRSKSFDARADGYGRGEGGGVVVLKDYEAAMRDGDEIIAIVEGSGINQDGRTSGITVPNPEAQRRLMQKVLLESGCDADDVDYIEAHGTGTAVGDPLETRAIADIYGKKGRCVVGSVKSSIGHLEAAAGIASVIKTLMMLRYNIIPPVAGLEQINPAIPVEVHLPREPMLLSQQTSNSTSKTCKIAINSFGYGGTNAHVILSSTMASLPEKNSGNTTVEKLPLSPLRVLPLSARDAAALKGRADQIMQVLESCDDATLENMLFTLSRRRAHLTHRVAVWGESKQDLIAALRSYVEGNDQASWIEGTRTNTGDTRIVFIYTGMGPQWYAMGRQLFNENVVFRATLETADAVFTRIAGFSIVKEMSRDEASSEIKRTEYAQPANLMVQIGLTAALQAEGVMPSAVMGHSVGEVASAWASGMLTLEEALLVSRERSRIQATTAGQGGMLALGLSADKAAELIQPYGEKVSLAALNSPQSVTVAGDIPALEAIRAEAAARKIFARKLDVEIPYHSPLMEKLKPELREKLAALHPVTPKIPLYSTVSGKQAGHVASARFFDAEYWCDNVRDPVCFADGVRALLDDGYTLFVEVGPHPVLRRSLEEIAKEQNVEVRITSTLWMNKPETPALRRAIGEIFVNGGTLDWARRVPNGSQLQLPAYPWQRKPLWRESFKQESDRLDSQVAPLNAPNGADLNLRRLNYLLEHVVDGASIMPAAGYLEALCEEARRRWPANTEGSGWSLRNVKIHGAMILDHERALKLEVRFNDITCKAELFAHDESGERATVLHADALMHPFSFKQRPHLDKSALLEHSGAETVDSEKLYTSLRDISLQYGPAFQSIVSLRRDMARGEAIATLTRPETAGEPASAYILHPALLDGCFQSALCLLDGSEGAYLPVSLHALEVFAPADETLLCHTRIVARDNTRIVCDFALADKRGTLVARIKGLVCIAMRGKHKAAQFPLGDYQRVWREIPALSALALEQGAVDEKPQSDYRIAILANSADRLANALAEACAAQGITYARHTWAEVKASSAFADATHVVGLSWAGCSKEMDPTGEDEITDLLSLVQTLNNAQRKLPLRIVTRGAAAVNEGEIVKPAQTAVAGFMRVVRNELVQLEAVCIDIVEETNLFQQGIDLLKEVFNTEPKDEIALRGTQRYRVELVQSGVLQQAKPVSISTATTATVELSANASGYSAHIVTVPTALPDDTYEIRIENAGVRLSTELAYEESMIGITGIVTRVGSQAKRFLVGERVCGWVPHRLASSIIVSASDIVLERVPANCIKLEIPGLLATVEAPAFLIAETCALTQGMHALIGAGVVGDALSRRLKASGVHVVRFDEDLKGWQAEAPDTGFDLIAAPLARWSKQVGFFALADGGHLVDLGSNSDVFALPTHCGRFVRLKSDLNAIRKNPDYSAALRSVLAEFIESPHLIACSAGFADLVNADPLSGDSEKPTLGNDWINLRIANDTREFNAAAPDLPAFRADGTYLVTGGFGGLGSEVARWLAKSGAGHIALVSRRGANTPAAMDLLQELSALGASASAYAVDMADANAVTRLIMELDQSPTLLKGVFHAAGVLEDHLLGDMTAEHIGYVMKPKANGALALHNALHQVGVDPDYFVLFSSIANLVGNSRQANYCAANGFLDGLAQMRRAQNLPALSINFGAIAGVGMLESDARVGQHLTQIGMTPLDVEIALRGVGRALVQDLTQVAVCEQLGWEKWAAYEIVGGASPAFSTLVAASREAQAGDASLIEQLHVALAGMPESDARSITQGLIAEVVAMALKTSADRLKPDLAFDSFGVDSLMSTEIQIQLDHAIGVSFSVIELLGHATIDKLVDKAVAEIMTSVASKQAA